MNSFSINRRRSATNALGALVLTLISIAPAQAALTSNKPWTTIGSVGSQHLGTFAYQSSAVFLSSPTGVLRYNVVAVDGLMENGGFPVPHIRMTARFRDPDAGSRVTITLRRTRISDGFTANVAGVSLDSNNFPASSGFQTRNTVCASTQAFDFVNYVYYVEVQMTRAAGAISPAIEAIQIGWDNGACIALPQ